MDILQLVICTFYPTAFKGSETLRCRKFILGRDMVEGVGMQRHGVTLI